MTRLAILESETLIGKELKEALGRRPDLGLEIRLLSTEVGEFGSVTDGPDGAALVQESSDKTLADVDVLVSCSSDEGTPRVKLPRGLTVIRMATSSPLSRGTPIVAGVNLHRARPGGELVSPHPTVVALAHFLEPLRPYGLEEASCWTLLPASAHGQSGIDELLDQTRSILSFSDEQPRSVFGSQIAFNTLPAQISGEELAGQLGAVFDHEVEATLQVLQAGIFHGVVVAASFRLRERADSQTLRQAVTSSSYVDEPENLDSLGPVEVAGSQHALLGGLESSPSGLLTLWGVMDNLTTGGADNVLSIVEAIVAPRH